MEDALSRLLPVGWVVAVAVAVAVYALRPDDELGFSLLTGSIALAMALWTQLRASRASAQVSLVLGGLWTLLFGGYAIAGLFDDEGRPLVFLIDAIAAAAGVVIVLSALTRLSEAAGRASA